MNRRRWTPWRKGKRRRGFTLAVGLLLIAVVVGLMTYALERLQANRRWLHECELQIQRNEIAYAAAARAIRKHELSPDFRGDDWEIQLDERLDSQAFEKVQVRLLVKTQLLPILEDRQSDWIIEVSWRDTEQTGTTVQRTLESHGRRIKER